MRATACWSTGTVTDVRRHTCIAAIPPGWRQATMVIEVSGLTKRYNDVAVLSNVSLAVREREILGIIGPNGAGKTTLLECLAGLLAHEGGEVRWHGAPLRAAWRKKALFYLPDGVLPDN